MAVLAVVIRIPPAPAIAEPRVQHAVRAELQLATVVIGVLRMGDLQHRVGRRRVGAVGIARDVVAHDPDVAARIGKVDVEPAIGRVLRMKRHTQQPALAARRNLPR